MFDHLAVAAGSVSTTLEPSSVILLGIGLLGLTGVALRRRFRQKYNHHF